MVITAAPHALTPAEVRAHLGTPADSSVVATERDTLVLDDDVPQVLVGLADVHALDGLGCLTGVLVRKTSIHRRSRPESQQETLRGGAASQTRRKYQSATGRTKHSSK